MNFLTPIRRGRKISCWFAILALVAIAACSDDDPVRPPSGADISGVVLTPEGRPAFGAMVYLGLDPAFMFRPVPVVIDSVMADGSGLYGFDDLSEGSYMVYAGVWNSGGDDFTLVSPFGPPVNVGGKSAKSIVNLALHGLEQDGVITGEAVYTDDTELAPADSADVYLYRFLGAGTVFAGETKTNAAGLYAMPGISTGNYTVTVSWNFPSDAPFPVYLAADSEVHFCAGDDLVRVEKLILRDIMVEKPAVYIYPEQAGEFQVGLDLGPGVRLTASDPEYGEGWSVYVDRTGRIDATWDYLFYEVSLRGSPRIGQGWCFSWSELFAGLEELTGELGLNPAEQDDFLTYWRERMPRREYYEIHPVLGADLDPWVRLRVDPEPESSLRFWLFFTGRDTMLDLPSPLSMPFTRTGTTVVEWGGAILP
jgi:hypothetical protein